MTEAEFIAAVLQNPVNRIILERLPSLDLPQIYLVSGAVFQTVWNILTGRAPEHGIRDYDIFYFDTDDSWEAEDRAITSVVETFSDLDATIEIRNQARVHHWYEEKFGAPYPKLTRATDGIDRFLTRTAQVGISRHGDRYEIYAPHGFDDIAQMIVRPNRTANFQEARYLEKAERWKSLWPEITIISP